MKLLRIKLQDDSVIDKNFKKVSSNLGDISAEAQIKSFIHNMASYSGFWSSNNVWIPYHEVISANIIDV
jgi:hypothetical protein